MCLPRLVVLTHKPKPCSGGLCGPKKLTMICPSIDKSLLLNNQILILCLFWRNLKIRFCRGAKVRAGGEHRTCSEGPARASAKNRTAACACGYVRAAKALAALVRGPVADQRPLALRFSRHWQPQCLRVFGTTERSLAPCAAAAMRPGACTAPRPGGDAEHFTPHPAPPPLAGSAAWLPLGAARAKRGSKRIRRSPRDKKRGRTHNGLGHDLLEFGRHRDERAARSLLRALSSLVVLPPEALSACPRRFKVFKGN